MLWLSIDVIDKVTYYCYMHMHLVWWENSVAAGTELMNINEHWTFIFYVSTSYPIQSLFFFDIFNKILPTFLTNIILSSSKAFIVLKIAQLEPAEWKWDDNVSGRLRASNIITQTDQQSILIQFSPEGENFWIENWSEDPELKSLCITITLKEEILRHKFSTCT